MPVTSRTLADRGVERRHPVVRDPGARVGRLVGARAAERVDPAVLRYARARAVSVSVTSSAAPWFTNGFAVSAFG